MKLLSMEATEKPYDCAIIGGGLAGLCLSIQLADKGISVILFEKNEYPFHKVCGEYISMESWDFLTRLGVPLDQLNLPVINELGISSENGFMLNHKLDLGGFGISRFSLDAYLAKIALQRKVRIVQNCNVHSVEKIQDSNHQIQTSAGSFEAEILCGSYGRYKPSFANKTVVDGKSATRNTGNFIGVKYHINARSATNRIELHNFQNGYCGISKIDNDAFCLCYLTTAKNLRENGNDIKRMEEQVLYKNPFLRRYFTESTFLYPQPLVISNVQFRKKSTFADDMFLLGDAAGSITPLCGNGMSMGMRASRLLTEQLLAYFEDEISMKNAVQNYNKAWDQAFGRRIEAGYYLQNLFGKKNATHLALRFLDRFPVIMNRLISLTHGSRF